MVEWILLLIGCLFYYFRNFQKITMPHLQPEEAIENNILSWLDFQWVHVEKKITKWYYNEKKWFYQKNKSPFARNGSSDIHGTLSPTWRWLYIEVKQPKEMAFFDRPVKVLQDELHDATYNRKVKSGTLKKYQHALEQAQYIEEKIKMWAVAFFACSVQEVERKLRDFGIEIS